MVTCTAWKGTLAFQLLQVGWTGGRKQKPTFFFTVRGCSVARITSSFCRAPPSMASTWTFGLLGGKNRKAGFCTYSPTWKYIAVSSPGIWVIRKLTHTRHIQGEMVHRLNKLELRWGKRLLSADPPRYNDLWHRQGQGPPC